MGNIHKTIRIAAVLAFAAFQIAVAQDNSVQQIETENLAGSHRLSPGLGHTQLAEKVEGQNEWLALASWSLNYDYWFTDRVAVGLQNDLIMEEFLVETGEKEVIERKYPLAVVPSVLIRPWRHFSLVAGVGMEYTSDKTLAMSRLGVEYGWRLPGNWELGAALAWDNNWDYYQTIGLAITISRIWEKKTD